MPGYLTHFTETLQLAVPAATHGLGTGGLLFQLYTVLGEAFNPGSFHVTLDTGDVLVRFNAPQSGLLLLLPVTVGAIDPVPGSPTANTYCSVDQATAFLQERLHVEAWYATDPAEAVTLSHRREAALIQATRLLDTQVLWYGRPTTMGQALAWPQTGQVDRYGRPVEMTTIPVDLQRATAYYALALLEDDAALASSANSGGGDLIIKSKKIGDTQITYQDASSSSHAGATPGSMPSEVKFLLTPYGMVPGFGMIPVFRT